MILQARLLQLALRYEFLHRGKGIQHCIKTINHHLKDSIIIKLKVIIVESQGNPGLPPRIIDPEARIEVS